MRSRSGNTIRTMAADWVARRDAGLSPAESAEMQAWLDADERHREALARCDSAWSALDRPHRTGATDDLLAEVESRVGRRHRHRIISSVAGLAVLFAVGLGWRLATVPQSSPLEQIPSGTAVVVVPSRQILPDGSMIELNAGAVIVADFQAQFRRVILQRGEAHFQVAKDATRPFIVAVDNIEVRAVGTAFSVQRASSKVEVLVTEGQVVVDRAEDSASTSALPGVAATVRTIATLEVGHRTLVELAPNSGAKPEIETLPATEVSERLAWRAPRLEFTGTPLSEAVALLNEQSAKAASTGQPVQRYSIDDPEIVSMRVSGLFRVDNTDSFVRLLKFGFGIEARERENTGEIVLRKSR